MQAKPVRNELAAMNALSHDSRVFKLEQQVLLALCENIGSPRALTVHLLVKAGEYKQLLELEVNPLNYTEKDLDKFAGDYLVTAALSKSPRLPINVDKKEVAFGKFRDAERLCTETNVLLDLYASGRFSPLNRDIHRVVHHARECIRKILGPLTRARISEAERLMAFGPGATTSVSGVVTQGRKYSQRSVDATPRLLNWAVFCLPPGWRKNVVGFNPRDSSKMQFVPKNAKTDRVICVEPDLNIYVQKGFGAVIRERLRLFGLDLNTQTINQRLARRAYDERLCTLDLSAASDCISRELVWLLLPYDWASELHECRTDYVTTPSGERIHLQKWSSMGNGYTFELETLIFYAILQGVAAVKEATHDVAFGQVGAYGDDLIFPSDWYSLVTGTLNFLGFKVNKEKTFGKGLFYESCGSDWFTGRQVRPVFLRSQHVDFPSVCYTYANQLRHWAYHRLGGFACDRRILPAWLRCFTAVTPRLRFRIPPGYGDVGFATDLDAASAEKSVRFYPRNGWSGWRFAYRRVDSVRMTVSVSGCLTAFLNGVTSDFSHGKESLRGRFCRPATRVGYVLTWPNLGPWV